jgi:prepilin-type N-terminal cleavage/methylation domain-containing protein
MLSKQFNSSAKYTKGFTLIEILVAISIIILVTTISFAAFSTTRDRANDGKIKQSLGLMRVEAERVYKLQRVSDNICTAISSIATQELPSGTPFMCADGPGGYAFQAVLSNGEYFCMDFFGRERTNPGSAIASSCTGGSDCDCR